VQDNQVVIRPIQCSRHGWDEQFKQMAERGDDRLLDAEVASLTGWDVDEWEWE
jgi:antitoxin MazE